MSQLLTTAPHTHYAALTPIPVGSCALIFKRLPLCEWLHRLLNSYDGGELDPATFLTRFGFVPGKSVGEFVKSIGGGKMKLPFGFKIDDRKMW